jgi:hypothetical protein
MDEKVSDVIKMYVDLRDSLKQWQKEVSSEEAARKKVLEELEVKLLIKADEDGVDSFKTPYGTAFKSLTEHYRIADWPTFVEFVKETDNFALLQKRVTKTVAKEVHEETGILPLGLDYYSEYTINVRRPTKKKGEED